MSELRLARLEEWPAIELWLMSALERTDDWDMADVALAVLRGQCQLWAVTEGPEIIGGGVTVLETYPARRVLNVLLFAGRGDWFAVWPTLQGIARESGCQAITGKGRPGWIRKLGAQAVPHWEIQVGPDGS
jgi:hypothetical protein